ncbi:hypothetical protein ACIRPK_33880 [Kitasatospora sp. NPDC101801]|uniref:hypothetical protein n=1 Tax=Kitasatospora sp. NPDC101801 TaxID=3364103 RepID=UPI00382D1F24
MNAAAPDSPAIELSHAELEHLLAGVEQDLTDFLSLAVHWAAEQLPGQYAGPVAAALGRLFAPAN